MWVNVLMLTQNGTPRQSKWGYVCTHTQHYHNNPFNIIMAGNANICTHKAHSAKKCLFYFNIFKIDLNLIPHFLSVVAAHLCWLFRRLTWAQFTVNAIQIFYAVLRWCMATDANRMRRERVRRERVVNVNINMTDSIRWYSFLWCATKWKGVSLDASRIEGLSLLHGRCVEKFG